MTTLEVFANAALAGFDRIVDAALIFGVLGFGVGALACARAARIAVGPR